MFRHVILCVCVAIVSCHREYRDLIPNGHAVPNPCGSGVWEPVGHYDPQHHTSLKNPFGQAFASAGYEWTVALCSSDSDGDGVTNGQELGDPACIWTVGAIPDDSAQSHPGICEPVGSCGDGFFCGCHGSQCVE